MIRAYFHFFDMLGIKEEMQYSAKFQAPSSHTLLLQSWQLYRFTTPGQLSVDTLTLFMLADAGEEVSLDQKCARSD